MTKKIYGYVRVSTKEQNPKRQIQNLKEYGIDERDIIIDTCTGTNFRRSGYSALEKVLLEEGDELVILSIDRLGRNKNATKRNGSIFKQSANASASTSIIISILSPLILRLII